VTRPFFETNVVITSTPNSIQATSTKISPTFTYAPTQTKTVITPSPLHSKTATLTQSEVADQLFTSTPTIHPDSIQLEVFEELWSVVNDEYLYPDFNGLDWDAIHEEYMERIVAGLETEEFYQAMGEMISRLGDDHSYYLNPEEVLREDAEYEGNLDYVGIGILIYAVPEHNNVVVLLTFPGSPAEEAGIQSRDIILEADNQPILDDQGIIQDIIRGPEDTILNLIIKSPEEEPRNVQVIRQRINGSIPVPSKLFISPLGKRIGYILIPTFTDNNIDEQISIALESMNREGPLDGIIIDNRFNNGGADTVLRSTLGYFTSGTLGAFISRQKERPLSVKLTSDMNNYMDVPLVILIGKETASYGEVFAGILKDIGRAYLIGETTGGNVETLWAYRFTDGSRAWIAQESFRPLNNPDQDWEKTGVIPDLTVNAIWEDHTLENDPVILAALDYLEKY
jgi:C-terminal peptidase prc